MGLFDFNTKKKEEKTSQKSPKQSFEIGSDGLIFEAKLQFLTNSRDYAQRVSKETVDHIAKSIDEKNRPKYHVLSSKVSKIEKVPNSEKNDEDPMEKGKDVFRVTVELVIGTKKKLNLFDFSFNYLPFFIEVIEPMSINLSANELTQYATDIQATIHNIDTKLKTNKLHYENVLGNYNELAAKFNNIVKSANRLLRNNILMSLKSEKKTLAELEKNIGIPSDDLETFMKKMIEDKELKFEKKKYALVKSK